MFGEGLKRSRLMLVGEQPGDREAGIERGDAYVTNVVKRFKFKLRGKRRIHQKPGAEEIAACRPWPRRAERARFTDDLRVAAQALG